MAAGRERRSPSLPSLVAVGAGAEWLFRRWLGTGTAAPAADGDVVERPDRLLVEFIPLVVFALASAGLILLFERPLIWASWERSILYYIDRYSRPPIGRSITRKTLSMRPRLES